MPEVNIEATVQNDGSLHVVEERTFDFDGSFSCVWWILDRMNGVMRIVPNGVQIDFYDRDPEQALVLPEVEFETPWRSSGGPSGDSYSFDEDFNGIYVFAAVADEEVCVILDYTIVNAVTLWDDCAELYWRYLGDDWAEDSCNVSCVIALPAGSQVARPGEDVRAWGHGPLDGSVSFDEAGTSVLLEVPRVRAGEYAEARVVFPVEWLSLGAGYKMEGRSGLDDILEDEESWASQANRGRIASLAFFGVLGLVSLAAAAWAAINFWRFGREYRPDFTQKYWRDVPAEGVHPAVVGRLVRWNAEDAGDVLASLLHLANEGIVAIDWGRRDVPSKKSKALHAKNAEEKGLVARVGDAVGELVDGVGRERREEGYYITLADDAQDRITNGIDRELVEFLFGAIAKNESVLWLGDIETWGDAHKKSFANKMAKWQKTVSKHVEKAGYFEKKGEENQGLAHILAMALGAIGLYASIEMDNFWPMAFFGVAAVVVLVFSVFMPRRSREGAEVYARARALKRWLKDFTALDERVPTDVKVWGEFMVYAQVFGVADEVVRQLRRVVPGMFSAGFDPEGADGADGPGWVAFYDSGVTRAAASNTGSFAQAFGSMWGNTAHTAAVALAAASSGSGSGWSSGGGGGGGFSGGGGGGFGGGGGGAR